MDVPDQFVDMIDLKNIRQHPTWKRLGAELAVNAPPFFLALYGLACVVTLHARLPESGRGTAYLSWHLVPVHGAAAAETGLASLGFALFLFFSNGRPPDEDRASWWRVLRGVIRWGGAVAAFGFAWAALEAAGFQPPLNLDGESFRLLAAMFGIIAGIVTLLVYLFAMHQRECVKRELFERGLRPLHVWWCPAAYWVPWFTHWGATGFRVVYSGPAGQVHKAYCFVYRSFLGNPRWGSRSVKWLKGAVVHQPDSPAPWLYVDSEIVRSKLKPPDPPSEDSCLRRNPGEPSS